jgi:hypothetical protein
MCIYSHLPDLHDTGCHPSVAVHSERQVVYPYHDQTVHLEPGNHSQRMDLCFWIQAHPEMVGVILFNDQAFFTRYGVNNSRNVHAWSNDNPHETSVTNFQRIFSMNVWCGIIGNKSIGRFVVGNN